MSLFRIFLATAAVVALTGWTSELQAGPPHGYNPYLYQQYNPHGYTWHGAYANTAYGTPVSLVVPPSAYWQGHYSWGMPASHTSPVYSQFGRWNGTVNDYGVQGYPLPTPLFPSHTDQFGVYYVRGPWW